MQIKTPDYTVRWTTPDGDQTATLTPKCAALDLVAKLIGDGHVVTIQMEPPCATA